MLWIIPAITVSYLIGSIPTAYIFGRLLRGIDIRKFGSGNVGATNAFRVLGKNAGITVLILDILKGLIAVVFWGNIVASRITCTPPLHAGAGCISDEMLRVVLGLSCVSGHNWTIFLGFKGGKGIATTLGVLVGLAIKIGGLKVILVGVILSWLLIFGVVRIVSVASVLTGIMLPVYMIIFKQSKVLIFLSIILCIFIILRHCTNLKRFFQGKERRLF